MDVLRGMRKLLEGACDGPSDRGDGQDRDQREHVTESREHAAAIIHDEQRPHQAADGDRCGNPPPSKG